MTLTRIPNPASPTAMTLVIVTKPPLEAPYATRPRLPTKPETEPMLTIDAGSRRAMASRATSRATRKLPMRLTSSVRRNSSADVSRQNTSLPTPAEFTRPLIGPHLVSACTTATSSATLSSTYWTRPTSPSLERHCSRLSCRTSARITCQPSAKAASTTARPIPEAPPVTSTVFSAIMTLSRMRPGLWEEARGDPGNGGHDRESRNQRCEIRSNRTHALGRVDTSDGAGGVVADAERRGEQPDAHGEHHDHRIMDLVDAQQPCHRKQQRAEQDDRRNA